MIFLAELVFKSDRLLASPLFRSPSHPSGLETPEYSAHQRDWERSPSHPSGLETWRNPPESEADDASPSHPSGLETDAGQVRPL